MSDYVLSKLSWREKFGIIGIIFILGPYLIGVNWPIFIDYIQGLLIIEWPYFSILVNFIGFIFLFHSVLWKVIISNNEKILKLIDLFWYSGAFVTLLFAVYDFNSIQVDRLYFNLQKTLKKMESISGYYGVAIDGLFKPPIAHVHWPKKSVCGSMTLLTVEAKSWCSLTNSLDAKIIISFCKNPTKNIDESLYNTKYLEVYELLCGSNILKNLNDYYNYYEYIVNVEKNNTLKRLFLLSGSAKTISIGGISVSRNLIVRNYSSVYSRRENYKWSKNVDVSNTVAMRAKLWSKFLDREDVYFEENENIIYKLDKEAKLWGVFPENISKETIDNYERVSSLIFENKFDNESSMKKEYERYLYVESLDFYSDKKKWSMFIMESALLSLYFSIIEAEINDMYDLVEMKKSRGANKLNSVSGVWRIFILALISLRLCKTTSEIYSAWRK